MLSDNGYVMCRCENFVFLYIILLRWRIWLVVEDPRKNNYNLFSVFVQSSLLTVDKCKFNVYIQNNQMLIHCLNLKFAEGTSSDNLSLLQDNGSWEKEAELESVHDTKQYFIVNMWKSSSSDNRRSDISS